MAKDVNIPWNRLLRRTGVPVYYRVCSERRAWRRISLKGNASFHSLDSALYESRGTTALFGNDSFTAGLTRKYGAPLFVVIWVDDQEWALVVHGRVGSLLPKSNLVECETISKKQIEQPDVIQRVREHLEFLHRNAESSFLIDPHEQLNDWTGPIGLKRDDPHKQQPRLDSIAEAELLTALTNQAEGSGVFTPDGIEDAREKRSAPLSGGVVNVLSVML